MSVGVYKITNPKGMVYIGSSKDIDKRFSQYKRMTEKSQRKLFNSFLKYGLDNHKFEIVELCDFENLYKRERYWGEKLNVLDREVGLNLALPKTNDKKYEMSEETKRLIGDKHRGKKISEKQKMALLNSIIGKKQSKEHIEKRKMIGEKNPMYGKIGFWKNKKMPKESCLKMSLSRKGKRLYGENSNAKSVIDKKTGKIYSSAKEVAKIFNINYSTLKAWLQKRNKNKGDFEYVK